MIKTFTPPSDRPGMTARDIALRGNMGSANFMQRGSGKIGLSRAEIVAQIRARNKSEKRAERMERIRAKLFPAKTFARVAAVIQTGTHNFRVLAGCRIPASAELSRGELSKVLRATGFTGYRFAKTGKRVLSLA